MTKLNDREDDKLKCKIKEDGVISIPEKLDNIKDLARRLQVSTKTIENLTKQGVIPAYKIGRSVRYNWYEVLQALRVCKAIWPDSVKLDTLKL